MPQKRIKIEPDTERKLREELSKKTDSNSVRLTRLLAMPDLSRTKGSPIEALVERILELPHLADFDVIEVPEIVPTDISFNLFDFSADHPARSTSDTYYVNKEYILRTHTTVMWYYYFLQEEIKNRIKDKKALGVISHGKVYRKDEIDRHHMNVFHQVDGLYIRPKEMGKVTQKDLENILVEIVQAIYGPKIGYRFNKDTFPYTDPSIEMEIDWKGAWLEVLGGGLPKQSVLMKLGSGMEDYTGWAFGFGIERLAMLSMDLPDIRLLWSSDERVKKQLVLGKTYTAVSKYPSITRDISFVVKKDSFVPNTYFDLIRDIGGDLVEEVKLLDSYEDKEKFGEGMISYTFRTVYTSLDRTLRDEEVNTLQERIYQKTAEEFNARLR